MARSKLPLPLSGLSDDDAFAEQQPGTTREAVNVRGIDPKTGRTRLSQRAGSTKYISAQVASTKIDAILPLTYDEPRMSYRQETADFPVEWSVSVPPGNGAYSPVVDRQGNVFVVAVSGTVYKYNSSGEQVATITPPVPMGVTPLRVIRLDETDGVYIAGTVKTGAVQGFIWKYVPDEDDEGNTVYRQAWTIERAYGISDFDVRGGMLALISDGLSVPDDPAGVRVYASLFSSQPYPIWGRSIPTPGNAIRINSSGDIVITCEPNTERGYTASGDGSWQVENIAWSPHEEYESDTRLHGWVDAKQIVSHADGEALELWEDRRYIACDVDNELSPTNHLQYGQPGATNSDDVDVHTNEPTDDDPSRFLYNQKFVHAGTLSLPAPRFRVGVHGSFPSVEFDSSLQREIENDDPPHQSGDITGCRLNMRPGTSPFKDGSSSADPTSSGTNAANNCFLVGHDQFNIGSDAEQGYGNGFCFFLCGVITDDAAPQIVWSTSKAISGGRIEYIFVANVVYSQGIWTYEAGSLGLYVETYGTSGSSTSVEWGAIGRTTWDTTERGFFIFSFVNGGTDKWYAGSTRNYESVFRINGIHIKRFFDMGVRQTLSSSVPPYFRHTIGGAGNSGSPAIARQVTPSALDVIVQGIGGADRLYKYSFQGHLFEGMTLLHPDDESAGGTTALANALHTVSQFPDEATVLEWGEVQPHDSFGNPPNLSETHSGTLQPSTYAADKEGYTKSATTVERIEGYMAHGWGSPDALPDTGTDVKTGEYWQSHPFGGTRVPFGDETEHGGYNGYAESSSYKLLQPEGIVAKYAGSSGELIWAETGPGIGYGLAFDDEDNPICAGPREDATSVDVILRKLIDSGPDVSLTATGSWTTESATAADESDTRLIRLASDSEGDVYWPVYDGWYSSTKPQDALRKYDKDDGSELLVITLDDAVIPYGAAFPLTLPVYEDDTITGPEFVYLATSGGVDRDQSTLYKLRMVHADQSIQDGQTLRRTDVAVVSAGNIKVVSNGALSTPTGGTDALLVRSPFIQAVQLFGEVFFTDGENYKVYNPRRGTVEDFASEDGGEIPERGRLLTAWRGRIIVSRAADDPYEIYASALGDPYSWDIYPGALSATQAWKGRTAGVGRAPDIVNAFIPMTDDLALIGGDHSIYRMTGDPAAGGDIDVLTDQVGVAFGSAWTKDPGGNLFFFGSRGGVFVLGSGGLQRLSEKRIERRLQDLDLEEYQVRLVWDYRREGLMVLPVPWTIGGVKHKAWFWESKTGAWWEDDWTDAGVQPSCVTTVDGDKPDDRLVLFGCEDGYLRYVDEDATNDDSARIDSRVLVGPLVPPGTDSRFRFMRPGIVLSSDQDGCEYELYASQTADVQGSPWASGKVRPGRNPFLPGRTRGASVWFRLRNNASSERWALEDATIDIAPAGRAR